MTYRFGPFVADRTQYRVSRGNQALEMTPKLLDLLFFLLDRPAALVTKEELLEGVWPGANVTDNALAQAVSELRDALGDSASAPVYIRTIARRGYRFIAAVNAATSPEPPPAPAPAAGHSAPGQRAVAVLDFTNLAGDPEVSWLSAGIAETVTSDMTSLDRFRVIDRWRVVRAVRETTGSIHEVAAALGAPLIVSGAFQRNGPQVRVTARLIDVDRGDAIADAKIDGLLQDVFSLQDGIVAAFARELGLSVSRRRARIGVRETSSLDAYRAYTEGWLKIESLDTDLVAASIQDFERAISLDPGYALAYTGLANAEFVAYEMTRVNREPNIHALLAGLDHARHAVHLDEGLAEAHATLSFLLTSALKFDEARAAAQTAVALEPDSWRHQYRLGHASWGDARLRALDQARTLYPQFPYTNFESAMVHVAQRRLDAAEAIVRAGAVDQDRQASAGKRFPAIGFHWLRGALAAARGRHAEAIADFDLELSSVHARRLYGPEYGAVTLVSRGQAELAIGNVDRALASFREARTFIARYPRSYLGESLSLSRLGDDAGASAARSALREAREQLDRTDRSYESLLLAACEAATLGLSTEARSYLDRLLTLPPSHIGWTVPIEPWLRGT